MEMSHFQRRHSRKSKIAQPESRLRNNIEKRWTHQQHDPHPQAVAHEFHASDKTLERPGHLFTERKWPDDGTLQLQDGIDLACFYCKLARIYSTDISRTEFAERRYDNTDALHKHVADWHIDRLDGSHRDVDLRPMILCKDGTERQPVRVGVAVPTLQKEAAMRAGWQPNFPMNTATQRELPRTNEENRAVNLLEDALKDSYLWDELPRLEMRDENVAGRKGRRLGSDEKDAKTASQLDSARDAKNPGLSAFVQYADGSLEKIPYGRFLRQKAQGLPMALCMIGEHDESRTAEFQNLVLSHQAAFVRQYVFDNSKKEWCLMKEDWMEYEEYLARKDKYTQWKAIVADLRDGLGRGNPDTIDFLNDEFRRVIKDGEREFARWKELASSFDPDLIRQGG